MCDADTNQSGNAVAGSRAKASALERGSPASLRTGGDHPFDGTRSMTDAQGPGPVGAWTLCIIHSASVRYVSAFRVLPYPTLAKFLRPSRFHPREDTGKQWSAIRY